MYIRGDGQITLSHLSELELNLNHASCRSALDIGCAVGGATFELTRSFDVAHGIDFSHAFVAAANDMKAAGQKEFRMLIEGSIFEPRIAKLPEGVHPERATFAQVRTFQAPVSVKHCLIRFVPCFVQGDACALSESLANFDAVLGANLLCRLPSPLAFLNRASSLLKQDGVLVLVSPYSWLGMLFIVSSFICSPFILFFSKKVFF